MKLDTTLGDLERTVSLCLRDGMCTYGEWPECHPLCSIYSRHRVYTASGGGLVYLARALAENRIGFTPTMTEFAYQCPLCEACDMCQIIPVPPPHVGPSEVIRFLRHRLVEEGLIPEKLKNLYRKVQRDGDYLGKRLDPAIPGDVGVEDAETVLFVEGLHSESEQRIYKSAIRLLQKIGKSVAIFDLDGGSCGAGLYDLGFWDELKTLVNRSENRMEKLAGKKVLFVDPHCQAFLMKRYPEIASKSVRATGRHFSEFLADAFEEGKLRPKSETMRVSYHDPCRLSRGLGIEDAPRRVISSLGMQLIEMKRNRVNTYCCGAGGSIRPFPDFSDSVASERIKEFEETKAELLITACPYCKEQFQRVLPPEERARVKDLTEFVEEQTD
jgi:heterodisulfide reductase subunit D